MQRMHQIRREKETVLFPTFQTLSTVSNPDSQCECRSLHGIKLATLQIQGADGGKEDNP